MIAHVILSIGLFAMASVAQTQLPNAVGGLGFMSGCWTTPKNVVPEVRECYTAPYAGVMQGSSQTVKDGQTTQVEFITIRENQGRVVYAPMINGKALSTFTLSRLDDTSAVFENPQNEFPKKIVYRREGAKSLLIRLEGAKADDPGNEEIRLIPQGI